MIGSRLEKWMIGSRQTTTTAINATAAKININLTSA
jgi:hypothetical protein